MIFLEDAFTPDPTFDDGSGMDGFMGVFWVFFVIVVLIGIGTTIWKITAARDMARRAGMDPDEATAMTVLTDNGLEATYLASNLRGEPAPAPAPAPAAGTTADRLRELQTLKDQGLVTEAEYAERRRAILDQL